MGQSNSRRQKRQKEQAAARRAAASKPVPAGLATFDDVLDGVVVRDDLDLPEIQAARGWEMPEINFMLTPGGMLRPDGAPPLVQKAKTVRVPGPLNAHILMFQARHGGDRYFSFEKTAMAMWRLLMSEEHAANELALWTARQTGVPAQPVMGPLYRKVLAELEEMRREDSGEIFDEG
jgi:hypothetical protein